MGWRDASPYTTPAHSDTVPSSLDWQESFATRTMGSVESKIPKNTPLGCLLLDFTRLGYSQNP